MINVKYVVIIAIGAFAAGSILASPVPAAIAAIVASDVQCMGCVGTSDIAGNAVTAAKIKDGEVKAADIATDAVGASELQGVTKLLYGQCNVADALGSVLVQGGNAIQPECNIAGADGDDSAIATLSDADTCFHVSQADIRMSGIVTVNLTNGCSNAHTLGSTAKIALIVFDK